MAGRKGLVVLSPVQPAPDSSLAESGVIPKKVSYRPLCGTGIWPAAVLIVRNDGSIDIEVECGGIGDSLVLHRVRYTDRDVGRCGACFPLEAE